MAWAALALVMTPARAPVPQDQAEIAARLDDYLTRAEAFGFSGVVLVAKQGEIVLCKGYGVADRASDAPFTADTAFDIASLTKQFTAAATLKLESMGKLSTSDPLAKFFPDAPADKAAITLHHLLTHTSGLVRGEGDPATVVSRDEMVARILATPLAAEVGARFSYSNQGYTLLAAVIELASGQTFQSFMKEQLFDPLGMSRTGFYGDAERWGRGSVARSYFETEEESSLLERPLTWSATGGGFVVTTAPDLLRWERELRAGRLLSDEAKRELFTPHAHTDGAFDYGYGWHVKDTPGARLAFHAGYFKGAGCEYRRYLDRDIATFVATNVGYLGGTGQQVALSDPVATIALGREQAPPPPVVRLDERALAKVCGTYRLPSGSRLYVRLEHGRLEIEAAGQDAFDELLPADPSQTARRAELNTLTARHVEALQSGDPTLLEESLEAEDARDFGSLLAASWHSIEEHSGHVLACEVHGTAPYPFNDDALRTYVELELEHTRTLVTFGHRNGRLFDLGTWEGLPNPGAMALAPLSAERFTTFDLWTGKATPMEFLIGDDGAASELILGAHGEPVGALRVP